MGLNEWLNTSLPAVVGSLEDGIRGKAGMHSDDGLDLAGRNSIYVVLDDILAVLFPGAFCAERVENGNVNFFLNDMLRHIAFKLDMLIRNVLEYHCRKENCEECSCERKAEEAVERLIGALADIRSVLLEDIQAAYEGDPAAYSLDEIVLSYPCVEAIATYRIAHLLYTLDIPIIPRIMSERAHGRTGIDIHPGAVIGPRFFIDHGTGVVIGETCIIGKNVKLYQGVTLGALSFPLDADGKPIKGVKRHPEIGDDVVIYANATILGGNTIIGKGAEIGGNTWITKSVPPGAHIFNRRG